MTWNPQKPFDLDLLIFNSNLIRFFVSFFLGIRFHWHLDTESLKVFFWEILYWTVNNIGQFLFEIWIKGINCWTLFKVDLVLFENPVWMGQKRGEKVRLGFEIVNGVWRLEYSLGWFLELCIFLWNFEFLFFSLKKHLQVLGDFPSLNL